jgi:hypothetical protein
MLGGKLWLEEEALEGSGGRAFKCFPKCVRRREEAGDGMVVYFMNS